MGSIPGAAPVLFFASPTVLGGTIIKIDLFLRLSRHKTCKFGQLQRLRRKDIPKNLCIRVDSNPRSLVKGADGTVTILATLAKGFSPKETCNYCNIKPQNSNCIPHMFFDFIIEQVFNFTAL